MDNEPGRECCPECVDIPPPPVECDCPICPPSGRPWAELLDLIVRRLRCAMLAHSCGWSNAESQIAWVMSNELNLGGDCEPVITIVPSVIAVGGECALSTMDVDIIYLRCWPQDVRMGPIDPMKQTVNELAFRDLEILRLALSPGCGCSDISIDLLSVSRASTGGRVGWKISARIS